MNDFAGIDKLGLEIFKRWKKLDILISNAAILGTLGPIHHQNNDEFVEVLNVNLVSNHRLIRSLEPLLKNSDQPKACFLSSTVANEVRPFWGAYAVSKAALEHMVKTWSMENKNNNLSIPIKSFISSLTKVHEPPLSTIVFSVFSRLDKDFPVIIV